MKPVRLAAAVVLTLVLTAGAAAAQSCSNSGAGFERWLGGIKQQARAQGIGPRALAALDGLTYDSKVIRLDRNQRHFSVSFEKFIANRVTPARIAKGRKLLASNAKLLAGIEQRYRVPPEIIVAIWGMETDYGVNRGNMNVFRSLATLAYDCRRSDFFRNELMAALQIANRGWLSPGEMRGAWAGELGQTQFLASNYLRFAIDYNGDGRRDLIRSTADVLGSTANYLKGHGWQRGGGYSQPALREWNKSTNYTRALAYFAEKLKGR